MKFEFSAGGIVVKRETTQNQTKKHAETIEVLLCQHSQHHGWVFPKGLIGDSIKNESKESTAIREVEEETGAKGQIVQALSPVTYWYQFEGKKIKKTVYYYLMKYIGGDTAQHDHEMENVEWLQPNEVTKRLTYPSDKKVWEEAKTLISKF